MAYAAHFILMGDLSPAASSSVSSIRNLISLKTKSLYAAWSLTALVIILGCFTVKSPTGMIPIIATVIAIFGMFRLEGVPFRLTMLFCTGLWLTNNILCHSIGGMILETMVAAANTFTITRLIADHAKPGPVPLG
jgi:hypothetical protein